MYDSMNELVSLFVEAFDLIFHSPLLEFIITIPLISAIFSVLIRCIRGYILGYDVSFSIPSFKSHDSHNKKYDEEIRSLLCTSPKETIDLLYEADKEYLVEYFIEHLSDFYVELLDNDDET